MKIKNLFYLLLALPLVFAACEDVNPDGPTDTVLTLDSADTLDFTAAGGEGVIKYTFSSSVEGAKPQATCEANWVTNIAVDKDITFTVTANEGDARQTKIVVQYKEKSFEVAVNQAAKAIQEYALDMEMVYAARIPSESVDLPANYAAVAFLDESEEYMLGVILVCDGENNYPVDGTYSVDNNGLMIEMSSLYVGEEAYAFVDGTVDVEWTTTGDAEVVAFDITLVDAEQKLYHFTFSGEVEGLVPSTPDLPIGDVEFTATHCDGICYGTEYSESFNYFVSFSDKGFSEDGYFIGGGTYYQLDIYGYEGVVDADGYITIPAGTYTFDEEDTTDYMTIGAFYSGYYKVNDSATAYEAELYLDDAELVVTADGATLTAVVNGYTHVVTFEGAVKIPAPEPTVPADDVEFTANYAYATYYGDFYSPNTADNYYFFLSDVGLDADGYEQASGTYYRFDIFTTITDGTAIPVGTYPLDVYDTCDPWTTGGAYGAYYVYDAYGYDYETVDYPESGYITFNEDGSIVAEYTMMISGATHIITYDGSNGIVIDDKSGATGGDDAVYSTLTGDYRCNLSDHMLIAEYYGDYYEVGNLNWMFALWPNSGEGDYIQFDVLGTAASTTDFYGEYTINSSYGPFTAVPGYIFDGYLTGSWYFSGDYTNIAPLVSGWLDVVDNGDGTMTIEFDGYDDLGFNISGTWTGTLTADVSSTRGVLLPKGHNVEVATPVKSRIEVVQRIKFGK